MRITVRAKPSSKVSKVEKVSETQLPLMNDVNEIYNVYVKEPPVNDKANKAIVEILADYFKVSKSEVSLVRGGTNKVKIFEILK